MSAWRCALSALACASLFCGAAQGATVTLNPGACANAGGIGSVAWSGTANAGTDNGVYASASVDASTTNYLSCTNYGFALPAGSRIDGITVRIERKSDRTSNGGSNDAAVRIVKGGAIGLSDKANPGAIYPTTVNSIAVYGGSTDLWGETWTAADINAGGFGAALAATKPSANGPAHLITVDFISITVDYTPPPAVVSINRASVDPAVTATVDWTVTFSEAVTGVDISDYALVVSGLGGSSIASITGGPIVYTVTANTGFGIGTLGLNLVDDDTILNAAGVPLAGVATVDGGFTGQIYTVVRPPPVSDFNAFETGTAAGAITGRIFMKKVSTNFAMDVVAIALGAQSAGFSDVVQVDLVTGSFGGTGCPGAPTPIAGTAQPVNLTNGRGTTGNFNLAMAYPDVRVRIRYPVAAPTVTSCSTDNFSIRPSSMAVASTNAANNGTSGSPTFKTGAAFNLTATALPGYTGTPTIDNSKVVGSPNAGGIGGAFSAAVAATGTATGNNFFYSEVGNFGLNANAVYDSTFTAVDQPNDCTPDFSEALIGGQYGCSFGSAPIAMTPGASGFGRFIPDNFNVTYNAPSFSTVCFAGTFTYVGQTIPYATAPQMTVTARSGTANGLTNTTTRNYAGPYMKLSNVLGSSLNQAPYDTQDGRYARFDALGGGTTPALDTALLPLTTADPAIGAFADGEGSLTFASGLALVRSATTPSAPFDADIALSLNVIDTDGVVFAGNPARFGQASAGNGMAFSNGKAMRFGRLRLENAVGSEKLNLPIPIQTQYWTGTAFQTNSADNCTTLSAANISLSDHFGGITAANTPNSNITVGGAFAAGVGSLTITKPLPAPSSPGAVTLTVNLTAEAKSYLKGNWGVPTYTADPRSRAAFGLYGGQPGNFLYFRENY